MYTSLLYNINVATSITSQGRALVSSMTLFFESFLANNVQFGSLNEVLTFISNIVNESPSRKFNSFYWIDDCYPSLEQVFVKVVMECGYRWIPSDNELEIIWNTLSNLSNEERLRIYYKNNLYDFIANSKVEKLITGMIKKLKRPMYNSVEAPEEIQDDIKLFSDLLGEYVYYRYMYIDRTDRCDNMIKSVTMVSDTDSTIISLDAWYRYVADKLNGEDLRIANYCKDPIIIEKADEDGNFDKHKVATKIEFPPKKFDYNFATDEIVEMEHNSRPDVLTPNDNVRYSIINIMGFVLDRWVNDYMEKFCLNNHSLTPDRKCKILAKNEYLFKRLMMTTVKKNYASIMEVQEGNMVPYEKQLDVKGIECLTKSTKSKQTRDALKKILLEDILRAPVIDQLRFIKDIAIFEKQIVESIRSGSKDYYKPATVKAMNSYSDPMRIQGVKASIAWNCIHSSELPAINLDERNAVSIAKVVINKSNINQIQEKFPDVYENMRLTLEREEFKGGIDAVAIPLDVDTPQWLYDFIDYHELIDTNIKGFPYESIGVERFDRGGVNYTNIVKL